MRVGEVHDIEGHTRVSITAMCAVKAGNWSN